MAATIVTHSTMPGSFIDLPTEKKTVQETVTEISHPSSSPQFSWQKGPMPLIPSPLFLQSTSTAPSSSPTTASRTTTLPTDPYTHVASEMALVHNCIIRALNSIYLQSPHLPTSEYFNFTHYCLATYQCLCAHHDGEESTFFPEIERITGEAGLMDANVQGHRDFDTHFNEWGTWLQSVEKGEREFEAKTCNAMMDKFMPPLAAHLADEIPTLLALRRFGEKLDLMDLSKKEGEMVMGGLSKTTQLPVFFVNHDVQFEGGWHDFPPVPPPVSVPAMSC